MSSLSVLGIGAACLITAGVFHWLRIFATIRAVLAFVGTCIVTGGLFGHLLNRGATVVSGLLGSFAGKVFGVALPGILVLILLIVFIYDLHPRNSAGKRTMWVGIALAACLVAGVSSFPALNQVPAQVRTGVGNIKTIGG